MGQAPNDSGSARRQRMASISPRGATPLHEASPFGSTEGKAGVFPEGFAPQRSSLGPPPAQRTRSVSEIPSLGLPQQHAQCNGLNGLNGTAPAASKTMAAALAVGAAPAPLPFPTSAPFGHDAYKVLSHAVRML